MALNVSIGSGEMMLVQTLEEASDAVREHIDSNGLGAYEWSHTRGVGNVVDVATGKVVARISYNGRIWEGEDAKGR